MSEMKKHTLRLIQFTVFSVLAFNYFSWHIDWLDKLLMVVIYPYIVFVTICTVILALFVLVIGSEVDEGKSIHYFSKSTQDVMHQIMRDMRFDLWLVTAFYSVGVLAVTDHPWLAMIDFCAWIAWTGAKWKKAIAEREARMTELAKESQEMGLT